MGRELPRGLVPGPPAGGAWKQDAPCRKEPPQQPAHVGLGPAQVPALGGWLPSRARGCAVPSGRRPRPRRAASSARCRRSRCGPSRRRAPFHRALGRFFAPFASVEGLRPATVAPHAEAELMARLGRIKSELQAARRQHDAAVDVAGAGRTAIPRPPSVAAHRERKACLGAMRAEVRAQGRRPPRCSHRYRRRGRACAAGAGGQSGGGGRGRRLRARHTSRRCLQRRRRPGAARRERRSRRCGSRGWRARRRVEQRLRPARGVGRHVGGRRGAARPGSRRWTRSGC